MDKIYLNRTSKISRVWTYNKETGFVIPFDKGQSLLLSVTGMSRNPFPMFFICSRQVQEVVSVITNKLLDIRCAGCVVCNSPVLRYEQAKINRLHYHPHFYHIICVALAKTARS